MAIDGRTHLLDLGVAHLALGVVVRHDRIVGIVGDDEHEGHEVRIDGTNGERQFLRPKRARIFEVTAVDGDAPADLVPWVSASWASQFQWKGTGEMPEDEVKKMKDYVAKAHKQGRLVRFWATPDKAEAWEIQRKAGVDLINTDKLAELREFLGKK